MNTRFLTAILSLCAIAIICACAPSKHVPDIARETGLVFPSGVKAVVVGKTEGDVTLTFLYVVLKGSELEQLFSFRPFNTLAQRKTSNPFLGSSLRIEGWNPGNVSEGIGGMLSIDHGRSVTYFFDTRNAERIEGWLLVSDGGYESHRPTKRD